MDLAPSPEAGGSVVAIQGPRGRLRGPSREDVDEGGGVPAVPGGQSGGACGRCRLGLEARVALDDSMGGPLVHAAEVVGQVTQRPPRARDDLPGWVAVLDDLGEPLGLRAQHVEPAAVGRRGHANLPYFLCMACLLTPSMVPISAQL